MGDITKWCQVCDAAPGDPCKIVSGGGECDACDAGAPRVVTDAGALHSYEEGATMVPCTKILSGDIRAEPHFYRNSRTAPVVATKDEPDHYLTNYEARVPEALRADVKAKFDRWVAEGRNSNEIEQLVESLVLGAHAWPRAVLDTNNQELRNLLGAAIWWRDYATNLSQGRKVFPESPYPRVFGCVPHPPPGVGFGVGPLVAATA